MSDYINRIRQAIYRSPSGAQFALQFDDVSRSGGKKAAIHEFPQQNTASVQDLGNQAERFPMSVYFTGPDYDTQSDSFWQALSELGPGALQHPTYGNIPVLALTWADNRKLVDGLGRSDWTVEFIRVQTDVVFPITSVASGEEIDAIVNEADATIADSPVAAFKSAADRVKTKNFITDTIAFFQSVSAGVVALSDQVAADLNKAVADLTANIDELLTKPKELIAQIQQIADIVAKTDADIKDKIATFKATIADIRTKVADTEAQAQLKIASVVAFLGGLTKSTGNGNIKSRTEATTIIDEITDTTDITTGTIEDTEGTVDGYRPPDPQPYIYSASLSKDAIAGKLYTLKTERRITLATERTPLDLLWEFYGDTITDLDASLDEFIATNDLSGCEILLVPAGREVVYYA